MTSLSSIPHSITALCGWRNSYYSNFKKDFFREGIRAIGQHGSIAVIERFIKTLKEEFLRTISIPLRLEDFQTEVRWIVEYYNWHRPHTFLNGRTPNEACFPNIPANINPRFEPRKRWPTESKCAAPQAPLKDESGTTFSLHISYYEGRKHLPIVELKAVA
jgi:hypothetical protein